ncbi:MAG: class IV adenylate cyclase [Planctomycetota bacterium]
MYEVEVKFPVADMPALHQKLVALAGRFREPLEQVDRYFAHPARDFVRTDEALRLRRVGHDVAITWKGPRLDTATKTRREIELPLAAIAASLPGGPPATIERWTELLEALGFRRVHEVTKRRLSARVLWQGAEVEVALDSVAGLGDFVELELPAREGEVSLAQACVMSLAQQLGCGTPERRSYLEMVLAARKP